MAESLPALDYKRIAVQNLNQPHIAKTYVFPHYEGEPTGMFSGTRRDDEGLRIIAPANSEVYECLRILSGKDYRTNDPLGSLFGSSDNTPKEEVFHVPKKDLPALAIAGFVFPGSDQLREQGKEWAREVRSLPSGTERT